MRKKQLLLVLFAIILILPSFLVEASSTTSNSEKKEDVPKSNGEIVSKDEVVYATLHATGELEKIYVVNTLDVKKAGTIIDYGLYSSIKNLTDLSVMEQTGEEIHISAPEGKFYYQGNMKENVQLPWNINISYILDGREVNPNELAGKEGHLQIIVRTSANENGNRAFFENYLLQISVTLPDRYNNIETIDGAIANVGKNKQITFTAMPEQEGEFSLEADVVEFELQGIDIAAIPSTMSIDAPDVDEMTGDMESLTVAIKEINNGVGELNDGVSELNEGVAKLKDGSAAYQDGIVEIDRASSGLLEASLAIDETLATISESLNGESIEMDLTGLTELTIGLQQVASGLYETANGLSFLKENYSLAYGALDEAMKGIPSYELTEEQIRSLYMSGADSSTLDKLVDTYTAANIAKGTYFAVKEGFDAVETTLTGVSGALREMGDALTTMSNEVSSSLDGMDDLNALQQLQEGLSTLSANYGEFHNGLESYTEGVGQLASSYKELHDGMIELSNGTNELKDGVSELHDGTNELYESTSDLPDQMQEEIDRMIGSYDKSDFDPVSFVSENNEKVGTVQFVLKTEAIQLDKEETATREIEEKKGFWARLLDLFRS